MITPNQHISYLCPTCSLTVPTLLSGRENAENWFGLPGQQAQLTGKHATGMLRSECNGVYFSRDGSIYSSLMRALAESGFVEIEHGGTGEWKSFNLYHLRDEPVAEIQVLGSGAGVSSFLKLPDLLKAQSLHGFAVTGCKKQKGECQICGIRLFDHSSGSPLISYSDW